MLTKSRYLRLCYRVFVYIGFLENQCYSNDVKSKFFSSELCLHKFVKSVLLLLNPTDLAN